MIPRWIVDVGAKHLRSRDRSYLGDSPQMLRPYGIIEPRRIPMLRPYYGIIEPRRIPMTVIAKSNG
jgi:hypothetical protein